MVILWLAALTLMAADEHLPAPLVRGTLIDWVGSDSHGSFVFKTAENAQHKCAFSGKTYFENDHRRTRMSAISTGQSLEVLSERIIEPPRCRALIVRVVDSVQSPMNRFGKRAPSPTELFAPRGHLVMSGVVIRKDDPYIWIRTRKGRSFMIALRPDTRFTSAGLPSDRHDLPLNRPVQIRAGRNFDSEVEAYSIVWGDILRPNPEVKVH